MDEDRDWQEVVGGALLLLGPIAAVGGAFLAWGVPGGLLTFGLLAWLTGILAAWQ